MSQNGDQYRNRELHIHRLTHDTVHEISRTGDIPVETLMKMLASAEDHQVEYHFVFPDDKWIAGAWWRVHDAYGKLVYSGVDSDHAKKIVMDGFTLERMYVAPTKTKWVKVEKEKSE